jgi:hypothetical protein
MAEVLRMTLTQELVSVEQFGQVDVSLGRLYDSLGVPQDQMCVRSYLFQIPVIRVRYDVVHWMNTKHRLLQYHIPEALRRFRSASGVQMN